MPAATAGGVAESVVALCNRRELVRAQGDREKQYARAGLRFVSAAVASSSLPGGGFFERPCA